MAPLTKGRLTPERETGYRGAMLAAAATVYNGGILMRQADGYCVPGSTALNLVGVGVALSSVDNATGADGDMSVEYREGCFLFDNEAGDPITMADIGARCFVVDDQTVARTDGGATRSPAGFVDEVDAQGRVWVRFDEHLLGAAAA